MSSPPMCLEHLHITTTTMRLRPKLVVLVGVLLVHFIQERLMVGHVPFTLGHALIKQRFVTDGLVVLGLQISDCRILRLQVFWISRTELGNLCSDVVPV